MCENCVKQGLMTQEELDAIDAARSVEGPFALSEMLGGGEDPQMAAMEMVLQFALQNPERAASIAGKFSGLMEKAGWSIALVKNERTDEMAIAWTRDGFDGGVLVTLLPEDIASKLR